jgi:anhydro-N-acetylmuramic acid kinase
LQIGNPAIIAERTGITTVADFRRRDLAAGGQGAPLVPAFHEALFRSVERHRIVLNIGGIANITCLPSHPDETVTGFDTGPGNCLMDAWVRQQTGQAMDENGHFAARGEVSPALLERLLADDYFRQPPPKSTGTDYFSLDWLTARLPAEPIAAADVQATLLELTARSIAAAIDQRTQQVLVCGGGVHNPLLMQRLDELLPCPVVSTAVAGLSPDWVEAAAFAWLARQALAGQAGNLPAVTGAAGPRILGAIYPA